MPKQVQLLPNLRVDIPDLEQQTVGLSVRGREHFTERVILANLAAVVDGFRVEIANQGTAPRLLTVYNGVAFDRSGRILNNEEDFSASRSITLPADGTYSIEVSLVQNASDTDARGFWDPTFNNSADPSGDPRPKGREFTENVSTRITPDWQLVSPVSTTGFEIDTNANSTKIPVARIVVAGGVISGVSTTPWRSVLRTTLTLTDTAVKLFDTRGMPDAFTLTLDPSGANTEDLTITANDRENAILTASSVPTLTHPSGERVAVGGVSPAQFVVPATTSDKRPRLYQGDSDLGHLRNLDAQNNPAADADRARSDAQIDSLKAYIDLLAAQLREIKFGNYNTASLGVVGPPYQSLDTKNRYYDAAGGLLAARTNTVSIGDGVKSWGDFNLAQVVAAGGTDLKDVFIKVSAHFFDAGITNGVVFLKHGTYPMATQLNADDFTLIGENVDTTIIHLTGAQPAFNMGAGTLRLENLTCVRFGGGTTQNCAALAGTTLIASNCLLAGITGSASDGYVKKCVFTSRNPMSASLTDVTFEDCEFNSASTAAGDRAISSASIADTAFRNCLMTAVSPADYVVDVAFVSAIFEGCEFQNASELHLVKVASSGLTVIRSCTFNGTAESLNLTNPASFTVEDCDFTVSQNNHFCVQFQGTVTDCTFRGNRLTQTATDVAKTSYGLFMGKPTNCRVEKNHFLDFDVCCRFVGTAGLWVSENNFDNTVSAQKGRRGIEFLGASGTADNIINCNIEGNLFQLFGANVATVYGVGITVTSGKPFADQLIIRRNTFTHMGGTGGSRDTTVCIDLSQIEPTTPAQNVIIANNDCNDVSTQNASNMIRVSSARNVVISNNSLLGTQANMSGMLLQLMDEWTVTGNVVGLFASPVVRGIGVFVCTKGTITGNLVRMTSNTGRCIDLSDAGNNFISVAGNTIFFGTPGGTHDGHGIVIPTSLALNGIMVAGNTVCGTAPDGAGAGRAIARGDGSLATNGTRALTTVEDVGPGSYNDPGALNDVGLNYRTR